MATARELAHARQRNYQVAIDTAKLWASVQTPAVQPWAHMHRLIFAIHTESRGIVYANDGLAFHPDPAVRRKGWDKDDQGNPLPDALLADCYAVVRKSLDLPHDDIGNNGGSTGILQQLSQDYVAARFPGATWGWRTLANTMSVQDACWSFLDRVRVTSDRAYGGKDFDPIIADVLRVQQPKPEEVAVNYGAAELAASKDLISNWGPTYFTKDLPPISLVDVKDAAGDQFWATVAEVAAQGPPGPPGPPGVGGGRTNRGTIWVDDLPGATLADKLRAAWGSGDRRVIRAHHGDTLDVGGSPIPIRAGNCLMVGDAPQTEFSDNGRLYVRGSDSVFMNMDDGPNYNNTKGWELINVGFEGQAHLNLFKPQRGTGPKMAYSVIYGCSMDTFRTVMDASLLGPKFDILYTNNIYGPFAYRWGGSDGTAFPGGGKLDWGQGNSVWGRQALIVCDFLEKFYFGPFYATGEGSACLEIIGRNDRIGLEFVGATCEGRNANEVSHGAVVRMKSGVANFSNCKFNYANGSNGDRGYVDVRSGYASFSQCGMLRGNPGPSQASALIARGSSAVVDIFATREFPSMQPVSAIAN